MKHIIIGANYNFINYFVNLFLNIFLVFFFALNLRETNLIIIRFKAFALYIYYIKLFFFKIIKKIEQSGINKFSLIISLLIGNIAYFKDEIAI